MAIPTDYYVGKGTLTGMINSGIITSEMANHMQVYDGMQWITYIRPSCTNRCGI